MRATVFNDFIYTEKIEVKVAICFLEIQCLPKIHESHFKSNTNNQGLCILLEYILGDSNWLNFLLYNHF